MSLLSFSLLCVEITSIMKLTTGILKFLEDELTMQFRKTMTIIEDKIK